MSKVKLFTLAEIIVAMLLSSILILITYKVYNNVQVYVLNNLHNKHKKSELMLRAVLMRDINKANMVLSANRGFLCIIDSMEVSYNFTDSLIIRKGIIADTFKFNVKEIKLWNDTLLVLSSEEIVERVEIFLEINNEEKVFIERRQGASKEYFNLYSIDTVR
jgi:hypothetical protein